MGLSEINISNKEASKAIVSDIYLAQQELRNTYASQDFISINELRNISSKYSIETMLSALNARIADTKVSYNDIFSIAGNINKTTSFSTQIATNLIKDIYLYKLYQEVFDSTAALESFCNIGNASVPPSSTVPNAESRWADMLSGLINYSSTSDTYVKLAQYKLPSSNSFKIGNISVLANGGVYNVYAPNNINIGGVGYNSGINSFFPTVSSFIQRLKKGAYSSIIANWNKSPSAEDLVIRTELNDLTKTSLPLNMTLNNGIEYITGLDTNSNLSVLSIQQISSIVDLDLPVSSNGISTDLYNANSSNNSYRIPKWKIFAAAEINASIRNDLLNKTYNDIWSYIPTTVLEGLPETITRPAFDNTTNIYKYSTYVNRINVFANFVGLTTKQLTDKYTGIDATTDFSDISLILSNQNLINTKVEYHNSTLTQYYSNKDVPRTDVLSAWRHYKNVSLTTNLSTLQTPQLIADYLSDDFTKEFSKSAYFNLSELNDIEHRWTNYLTACNGTTNVPSISIDVIYDALKIIAQHKININNLTVNVHSGLLRWINASTYFPNKSDCPAGQTGDQFWGSSIDDLTQETNAKRFFAKYILNPEGQPMFKLLNNTLNVKYFRYMVKIGTSQTTNVNQEQIYGLDGACDVNTGTPISNWGTSAQIQAAMEGLQGWSENLKISRDLAAISTITTWSDLETKILPNYTLEKIVNLPKPLQKKLNNEYIINVSNADKNLCDTNNRPNMIAGTYLGQPSGSSQLNQKLFYTAMLFDIANSSVTEYTRASNVQKLINILADSTYKQFLELHINYSQENIDTHKEMFTNLLKHKFVSKFGKYGKTAQWRNIIVNTLNIVFGESMLDEIMVPSSPDYLTLSKSNLLKIIGDQIHYQLTTKMAYVDPLTNKPELRESLSKYVSDINTNQHYTKNIALGLAVAARSGNQYRLSKIEFDALKNAGVLEDTIKRMIVARPNINGYTIGGINFYALVGQNPTTGAILFE